jgi:hypothetical protein
MRASVFENFKIQRWISFLFFRIKNFSVGEVTGQCVARARRCDGSRWRLDGGSSRLDLAARLKASGIQLPARWPN